MTGFDTKSLLMGFGIGVIVISLMGMCILPFQQNASTNEKQESSTVSQTKTLGIQSDSKQINKFMNIDTSEKSGSFKFTDNPTINN